MHALEAQGQVPRSMSELSSAVQQALNGPYNGSQPQMCLILDAERSRGQPLAFCCWQGPHASLPSQMTVPCAPSAGLDPNQLAVESALGMCPRVNQPAAVHC